jgi:hypothetical protein
MGIINNLFYGTVMNRIFITIMLSVSTVMLSQIAFANRPAAEEPEAIDAESMDTETMGDADQMDQEQQQAPSAVEVMMQRQQGGDVVMLPPQEIQPGETVRIKLLDYPRRGMSMDNVQNEYGQPDAISDSVGKPPITSWTYGDRIVYFEYSKVIHVVAR